MADMYFALRKKFKSFPSRFALETVSELKQF